MKKLYIIPTPATPEINFSPEENIFKIRGVSSPEDVRSTFYPVIDWVTAFINEILEGRIKYFSPENPLRFQVDLAYFNSSSAKFLFDIFSELKRLSPLDTPVIVEWFYNKEDIDMKEAGSDIALLTGMEFCYIPKEL